jgi:thioredoxin-like negative regulator of GroEL
VVIAGGLVVVNFSAEWCGTSRMIEDELTKLLRYHGDVVFVMVSVNTNCCIVISNYFYS